MAPISDANSVLFRWVCRSALVVGEAQSPLIFKYLGKNIKPLSFVVMRLTSMEEGPGT